MYIPPSSPLNLNATLIDPDTLSESSIGMIAVKIYAFGGLAFMMGIVLYSLGLWVWTVVIKKEWANSPPELELHPERMREKERARQERVKCKKEEKLRRRQGNNPEHKFTPPPIRYDQKARSTSILKPSNRSSSPVKNSPIPSFSASPSKGLRVSWASSAATLDVDGHASEKLIETGSKASSLPSIKFPFDTIPTPIPRARTSIPHLSASIEARAPRGDEMIAVTTPDVCRSWSKPSDPSLACRCWDSVGPLETRNYAGCNIHRYKD